MPAEPTLILCELEDPRLPAVESYSPFCIKAHRALRAARLRYVRRLGDRPSVHKRVSPTGQVPVLLVDGEPVRDSTAILARVAELAPGAFDTQPEAWLWEELADTALNSFVVAARWADEHNWPIVREAFFGRLPPLLRALVPPLVRRHYLDRLVQRDLWRAGADACWRRFVTTLDQLDARAPAAGFWLGATLSVADLGLFAQLHSLRTPLTPWQSQQLAARGRLTAWLDRVHEATREPTDAQALSRPLRPPAGAWTHPVAMRQPVVVRPAVPMQLPRHPAASASTRTTTTTSVTTPVVLATTTLATAAALATATSATTSAALATATSATTAAAALATTTLATTSAAPATTTPATLAMTTAATTPSATAAATRATAAATRATTAAAAPWPSLTPSICATSGHH